MKKALRGCARLSLVDYTIKISNLNFVRDLTEIVEFITKDHGGRSQIY